MNAPVRHGLPSIWREPIEQGWSVFPVKGRDKIPLDDWKRWQSEKADAAIVQQWAARQTNVGIVTGHISGLVVLDLDSDKAIAEAETRGIPDTITVKTAKGRHIYFQHPGGTIGNRSNLFPGADIRGDGGFVVAPGSTHPTGAIYKWQNPPGLFDLAPMPQWLVDMLAAPKAKAEQPAPSRSIASHSGDHPYCLKALQDECAAIRSAPCGGQESTLNAAALKIGRYVGGGNLARQTASQALVSAGMAMPSHDSRNPWTRDIIAAKVDRGISDGMAEPKGVPETLQRGTDQSLTHHREAAHDPETGEILDNPRGEIQSTGVSIDHFRAYMPSHNYIFTPTGELWPASSVNSRLEPVPLINRSGEAMTDRAGHPVTQKASAWLDENRAVEQMTWAPGLPQVIPDKLVSDGGWRHEPGFNVFNLYRPPLPIEGDASKAHRWLDHVNVVYPDDADHLIRWLAHRVQRPQEKINHALVLGGAQGIGKDTILEGVKAAIGPWNFTEVSPQHMLGRFNGFVKSVILRVSEARDLGEVDRFKFYDHMKTYTAAPPDVLRVDEKHLREYSVFNVCGVIITTNHKTDGIYLPADDRRHYVAWSPVTRESFSDDYWNKLYGWYGQGGIGHVAAYLRELDLSDFDAKAPPRKTAAFWDIVSANATPEDAELADALDALQWPKVTTITAIAAAAANEDFRLFLTDRKNSRRIPHRLEQCGYVAVRNDGAKDGLFMVHGKRRAIYAQSELSRREQIEAANRLIGQ